MKQAITLSTPAARKVENAEAYYDLSCVVSVLCTCDEREQFERETGSDLDSDVLNPDMFSFFASWLQSNCKLSLQHVGYV